MENIAKLIKKNAKEIEREYLLPVFNVPEIYTPLHMFDRVRVLGKTKDLKRLKNKP